MAVIKARSRDGEEKTVEAEPGGVLMEPLRDEGLLDAVCGGVASCGTCHVYVAESWLSKTGERTEDEAYMLESLEAVVEVRPTSRLACQIDFTDDLDGLELEAAPDA
ncbi:MAG: 2Fe-2S iron-sulfur cluster-binding protein [Pseudomonadota bacterium]